MEEEVGDDIGMYQKTLYDYHKEAFYKAYTPYFNSVSNTHLITQEKYNEVKEALLQPKQPKEAQLIRKWRGQYSVGNNIDGHCLYRDGLVVVTFEEVFDVIREAHIKIYHMMDLDKNKKVIPIFVAGTKEGERLSKVVEVDPENKDKPLHLESWDVLAPDFQIQRAKQYNNGILQERLGSFY